MGSSVFCIPFHTAFRYECTTFAKVANIILLSLQELFAAYYIRPMHQMTTRPEATTLAVSFTEVPAQMP